MINSVIVLLPIMLMIGLVIGAIVGHIICAKDDYKYMSAYRKSLLDQLERNNWEEMSVFLTDKENEDGK